MQCVLRVPFRIQDELDRSKIEEQLLTRDGLLRLGVRTIPMYQLVEHAPPGLFEPQHFILATDLNEEGTIDTYSATNVADFHSWPFKPIVKDEFSEKKPRIGNVEKVLHDTWNIARLCADGSYMFNYMPDCFFFCVQKKEPRNTTVLIGDYKHVSKVRSDERDWILEYNLQQTRWALDALSPFLGLEEGEAEQFLKDMALKEGIEMEEYRI